MSLLDGKQLRDGSISLDKLKGNSGLVTFTSSATMSFQDGGVLRRDTADILIGVDVVNKEYVDAVASGLDPKEPVVAISATGPIALSGDGFSIDGWTVSTGERVLVNSQAGVSVATASNGIYVVATGSWSRATDSDGSPSATEVSTGNFVFVHEGTTYLHSGWVLSVTDATNPDQILVGTNSQLWVQFSESTDIQAGIGLYEVGTTFNVGAGTGIVVGATQVSIANTTVTAASYGGDDTIPTFTVNAQGQLTSATDVLIDITSGQVNNFTASSESVIFTTGNFVDGTTVDFTVTAGDSVTAEVTTGSLTASHLNSNSQGATAGYILSANADGTFAWILNDAGDITEVTAGSGLTGGGTTGAITLDVRAENGLTVDGTSDAVELGGTLTKNTTIDGVTFDFTLGNAGTILMTASTFDVEADGFVSIDAGTGSAQFLADDTITISASNSVDIVSTGGVYVVGASFSVNGVEIDPTSPTTGYVLTYDGTKFLPQAVAGGDITDVIAGDGLTGGATQGAATLNVVGGTGINANPDDIEINFTQVATGLQGNGLTANGGVLDVNVGTGLVINSDVVEADFTSLATNLQGNGLTANNGVLDVNVNADSLEIVDDVVRLKNTITGDRTFSDSVYISGNLTISGTATYVNTEELFVADNIITLNATYSTGSPFLDAGIDVSRGSSQSASLIWDETSDYWAAGLSGSESIIITEAGSGLSKSNNTLSVDFTSVATSLEGNGLTANAGVLSVNTSNGVTIINDSVQLADTVSGLGLTFSAGVINVGAGTGITVNADDVAIDFVSITGQGLTQSGGVISVDEPNLDYTTIAGNLDGAGLVVVGSELAVNTGLGMTISGDAVVADLLVNGGLTFSGNQIEVSVDNSTITIVNGQLVASAQGDITGVTAGAGLSGGGSSGFVTLDVNVANGLTIIGDNVQIADTAAGDGLTFSAGVFNINTGDGITTSGDAVVVNLVNTDSGLEFVTGELQVDLATNSGLTLTGGLQIDSSAAGDGLTFSTGVFEVDPTIAGTGLTFSAGVLSVVAGSAQPVYTQMSLTPAQQSLPLANDFNTTLTISGTPNDYSRVQVFVNGQLQNLGDGVKTTDCYFSATGSTAKAITDIVATDVLYWNGAIAGFRLTTTDKISISYEI